MSLKDLIQADINNVFFNADEFADWHDIDGKRLLCVVDDQVIRERDGGQRNQVDGLYLDEVTLSVNQSDLPKRPVRGQVMKLDGKLYLISKVSGVDMLEIVLEANDDRA